MPTNPPSSDGVEVPSEEPLTPAEAAKALNVQEVSIGPNNRKKAMPRGSKPGERRGGRQRGTPNKKTALRNAAIVAAASKPDISPLDFLLGVMRDPNMSSELRIKVAQVAAPLVHAKRGTAPSNDPIANAKLIDGACGFTIDPILARVLRDDCERRDELLRKRPLSTAEELEQSWLRARIPKMANAIGCPVGYGALQARKDTNRLSQLYCKRITPPSCGGGALRDAEDAEEAQLRARVEAYEQSPEGLARRRIRDLEMKAFSRGGRTTAEQSELDGLLPLYPHPPLDPDDPSDARSMELAKTYEEAAKAACLASDGSRNSADKS
jgi:hypothetical protein